jgi:hypothetical protein
VEALGGLLTSQAVHGVSLPARAAMWAAAALHQLGTSYCSHSSGSANGGGGGGTDGHCPWRWDGGVALLPGEPLSVDAESARLRMLAVPALVDALLTRICADPAERQTSTPTLEPATNATPATPSAGGSAASVDALWPSRARRDAQRAESVVAWAAAGGQ